MFATFNNVANIIKENVCNLLMKCCFFRSTYYKINIILKYIKKCKKHLPNNYKHTHLHTSINLNTFSAGIFRGRSDSANLRQLEKNILCIEIIKIII